MKRRMLVAALVGTAAWFATPATGLAFGGRMMGGGCGGCASPAVAAYAPSYDYAPSYGCGPTGVAGGVTSGPAVADGCGTVSAAPSYVTQTVTKYRTETRAKQVQVQVMKPVTKQVPTTTTEYVPETVNQAQQVTEYKQAQKQVPYTYTVNENVTEMQPRTVTEYQYVTKQVPYTYTVNENVTEMQPLTQVEYKYVTKQVPYTYTVNEAVTVNEPRTVTEYKYVTTQEPYTYSENVPTTTMTTQTRQVAVCVPQTVTEQVPVTRQVAVAAPAVDGCGSAVGTGIGGGCDAGCGPVAPACEPVCAPVCEPKKKGCFGGLFGKLRGNRGGSYAPVAAYAAPSYGYGSGCGTAASGVSYQTVTEMQAVTKTVMTTQYQTQSYQVPVTSYQTVTKTATRNVTKCVPETKTIQVAVVKYQPKQMQGTNNVTECVPTTKTVQVAVVKCVPKTMTGTRNVTECVPTTKTVQVAVVKCVPKTMTGTSTVTETVPVTKTVQVPVTTMKAVQKQVMTSVTEYVPTTETQTVTEQVQVPYTEQVQVAVASPAVGGCGDSATSYGAASYGSGYGASAYGAGCCEPAPVVCCEPKKKGCFQRHDGQDGRAVRRPARRLELRRLQLSLRPDHWSTRRPARHWHAGRFRALTAAFQFLDPRPQLRHFRLQNRQARVAPAARHLAPGRPGARLGLGQLVIAVEAVRHQRPAPVRRREPNHQVPPRQPVEQCPQFVGAGDRVHAARPRLEFPGRLRPAQQQLRHHRHLDFRDAPQLVEQVPPAVDAAAGHLADDPFGLKRVERLLDLVVVQFHHRVAVGLLVAPERDRVERHRVGVGRLGRLLLLDQHAEDAALARRDRRPGFGVGHRASPRGCRGRFTDRQAALTPPRRTGTIARPYSRRTES